MSPSRALLAYANLALRHRGKLDAVRAELEDERQWARFCARHDLPRDTKRPS